MLVDLITSQKQPHAYALLRMSYIFGITIGPAVGGFIAATSYNNAFLLAAAGLMSYGLLLQPLPLLWLP